MASAPNGERSNRSTATLLKGRALKCNFGQGAVGGGNVERNYISAVCTRTAVADAMLGPAAPRPFEEMR